MAVFSSPSCSLSAHGSVGTSSGSLVDAAWLSPKSNRPPWSALAASVSAYSKASDTLASRAARLSAKVSKAPALIKASTTRLLTSLRSTRVQKSKKLLNGPLARRSATMASMAPCPVPLTAPSA